MPGLKEDRYKSFYVCGKCRGHIWYHDKPSDVCPECGYSYKVHGTKRVRDIPQTIKVYLNDVNNE
jgi:rRNA maturation endonuclease Nob1